jgi:hypothetical protein
MKRFHEYLQIEDEFRYLQRKKKVVKEMSSMRSKASERIPTNGAAS